MDEFKLNVLIKLMAHEADNILESYVNDNFEKLELSANTMVLIATKIRELARKQKEATNG